MSALRGGSGGFFFLDGAVMAVEALHVFPAFLGMFELTALRVEFKNLIRFALGEDEMAGVAILGIEF